MSWSLARIARYVVQSKYLEKLKSNDELCLKAFDKGSFLMFFEGKPLLTSSQSGKGRLEIAWSSVKEAEPFCKDIQHTSVLLGIDEDSEDDKALFACPVTTEEAAGGRPAKFSDMRRAILSLRKKEACIVGRGYSLLTWNERMKFCPGCASPMQGNVSGTVRKCSKPCDIWREHYPVTHPVSIVRVTDASDEKVLLVRQPRHPKGMYSCIAGFMEPGEAVDSTVRREIAEEAGIVVEKIQYFDSQTWPLPQNSLMLAFTAVAMPGSEKIEIDENELEDGKWFTKEEVRAAVERVTKNPGIMAKNETGELFVPPRGAIAHELLRSWVGL
jgi:NAD+ diphosphatase